MSSSHHERARLESLKPALAFRSLILSSIRAWFEKAGFIEVDTPVRLPTPALEVHIDAIPSGNAFLRTSPELHMKRLLAAGYERIYQMGPCFRLGERGRLHHPEFTLLEWYRASSDYLQILQDTEALLTHVASTTFLSSHQPPTSNHSSSFPLPPPPWPRFTVSELFLAHAGWDPVRDYNDRRFEEDLVNKVEPALPRNTPVFVMDYPAAASALSRRKPGRVDVAERWELYISGVEIANAFSELTDAGEQEQRFRQWASQRQADGRPVYPLDEAFLSALRLGMPPSGGIAVGIDRLVMVLAGKSALDDVMTFREADIQREITA